MQDTGPLDPRRFDAVLLDLDGVLTATAKVHARCWQRMFDEFLVRRARETGGALMLFESSDYLRYVDGKPRYDGVRSFLASRGIALPEGTVDSPPDEESVCGLGNRKNELIGEVLANEGVEVYPGSLALVRLMRRQGVRVAVVSSSRNCKRVLEAAGIARLFEARVDGEVAAALGLAGKPAPDTFLYAAQLLGVAAGRAVVVEDAISGVEAGRDGGFGLVIGVARHGDAEALLEHGADIAVDDLGELLPPEA